MKQFLSVLLIAFMFSSCSREEGIELVIYPEEFISTDFIGNGVQWSAYPHADTDNSEWGKLMTDEKWEMNFERLDYMNPKLFRIMDQANWRYLVSFDEDGMPELDFSTPEVQAVEKILTYAQDNNITVLFGEWGTPYKMHDTDMGYSDMFSGANDPNWIDCIVAYLDYLILDKGYTCIKYYNLVNEPNGDWASTEGDFVEWKEGVELLASELKEKGLDKYVQVAGPDAVTRYDNPRSTYTGAGWVEESVRQLDDKLGIYEVHDYTDHELVKSGGFKSYHEQVAAPALATGKQIIFGELGFSRNGQRNQDRVKADPYASEDSQMEVYDYSYGLYMADALVQSMNAGYSGSAAWALDDAMHTLGDLGNKHELKRWGMWNSLGTELCNDPEDERMRPWFYSWSLLCRYFPTGSQVLKTENTLVDGLRFTAVRVGEDFSVAIVNHSDEHRKVSLKLPANKDFNKFLYFDGERAVNENGFPVSSETELKFNKGGLVVMPANSVVVITTLTY